MSRNGLADRHPEPDGHGVADHLADPFEMELSIRFYELVSFGKRLEHRAFPQGKTSILLRMAEAAIAETVELRRDRRRCLVPFHATVNTRIVLAAFLLMAFGAKPTWPVAPGSTRLRGTNAFQISSRKRASSMERVGCTHVARAKSWERSQDIRDFAVFVRAMRWRNQFDRPEARSDYDEPAAMLRNTITGTIDHPFLGVVGEIETFVGENR